ncbi:MAG TPA: restriction endonuclease [Patescibacteria group bacterium]|nr:restriction endonuclease [Patescibacteria group bacterium]
MSARLIPPIMVIKRNGQQVEFDDLRVIHSMERAGVPKELHDRALAHIKERIQSDNTITTDEIFYHIREFLTTKDKKSALRFNLKQGIFELGPTGFPFEQYLADIFKSQGYKTQVDLQMRGECVSHEIDVLLEKDGRREIIEAKFHNQMFGKTDVQVILYTYARFLDVSKANKIDGVWVATNTKLSTDAITYAECKGVRLMAWNYPEQQNLQDFVERPKMYPVTIMTDLTTEEKRRMIDNGIILVFDLLKISDDEYKDKYMIDKKRVEEIRRSAQLICGN